ncbi:sensor histidine kinase [Streptomyces celluloflavus]|uniref:sensor histidine kinase n=1 Tax=Streptomyces celluloflavus TaxID=58344 RepID=UPI0037BA7D2C
MAATMMLLPALMGPPGAWILAGAAAVALVAAIYPWPVKRISPARSAGAVAGLSLVLDFVWSGVAGQVLLWLPFEMTALLVLLYRVIRRAPRPHVSWLGGLAGTAVVLLPLRMTLHAPQPGWRESVFMALLAFLPAAGATGVGLYLRSLDDRRARAVTEALRDQRGEVARDLHDFVAHEVTGIVLEAQAAQLDDGARERNDELYARIEQAGTRALDAMDQMVRTLRTGEGGTWAEPPATRLYGLADLAELVGRFAAMTGARTELNQEDGIAGVLAREADDAAYRAVLESLTNIRRHAPHASRIAVSTGRTGGRAVEVTVADDGGGTPAPTRDGGGTGLAGLAERVGALGGTLEAGPHGGGWRVRCVLPAPAAR